MTISLGGTRRRGAGIDRCPKRYAIHGRTDQTRNLAFGDRHGPHRGARGRDRRLGHPEPLSAGAVTQKASNRWKPPASCSVAWWRSGALPLGARAWRRARQEAMLHPVATQVAPPGQRHRQAGAGRRQAGGRIFKSARARAYGGSSSFPTHQQVDGHDHNNGDDED
jgi:hypothetical protein